MGEYAAFHYLNHKDVDPIKAVYVESKPLTFGELYSPRDGRITIYKGEKSYWRTRDRIEFELIEDRVAKLLIVTCRSVSSNETFRTIFLNLECLYFELESKARETRDPLFKKKDKKLDDKLLQKAVSDYVLARLNICAEPIPWPCAFPAAVGAGGDTQPVERMCTFEKLSSDVYTEMEMCCPLNFDAGGLSNVKNAPTAKESVLTPVATATSESTETKVDTVPVQDTASSVAVAVAAAAATVPVTSAVVTAAASKPSAKKLNSVVPLSPTNASGAKPASTSTTGTAAVKPVASKSTKKVTPI